VIHPLFVPASLLVPLLLLLVLSLLAAFYPAWRAARLQPAAAIRHA
jgi:ABC-type lipoprotein release transport system permease subunit